MRCLAQDKSLRCEPLLVGDVSGPLNSPEGPVLGAQAFRSCLD